MCSRHAARSGWPSGKSSCPSSAIPPCSSASASTRRPLNRRGPLSGPEWPSCALLQSTAPVVNVTTHCSTLPAPGGHAARGVSWVSASCTASKSVPATAVTPHENGVCPTGTVFALFPPEPSSPRPLFPSPPTNAVWSTGTGEFCSPAASIRSAASWSVTSTAKSSPPARSIPLRPAMTLVSTVLTTSVPKASVPSLPVTTKAAQQRSQRHILL